MLKFEDTQDYSVLTITHVLPKRWAMELTILILLCNILYDIIDVLRRRDLGDTHIWLAEGSTILRLSKVEIRPFDGAMP